jgi:catechol-2,3-dioxygenase
MGWMEEEHGEGKVRHIAISVPDKEKAAKFYEETFGLERVSQSRVRDAAVGWGDEHHAREWRLFSTE